MIISALGWYATNRISSEKEDMVNVGVWIALILMGIILLIGTCFGDHGIGEYYGAGKMSSKAKLYMIMYFSC